METQQVAMTPDELREYNDFKAARAEKEAAKKKKQEREEYKRLVDETVAGVMPELSSASEQIALTKRHVLSNFQTILELKAEVFGVDGGQRTHTFTHSDGTKRITIGRHCTDAYRDTVNEGIEKVKQYIGSLAKDKESTALVQAVLRLLSKDSQGNLKASRVLQLRKIAEDSDNADFKEGVKIIEESYQPAVSKTFIRAELKNNNGEWISIPLGMTEA